MHAIATCQVRSPVRSECLDQSTIATTEIIGGIAFTRPTVIDDTPKSLMICGAQILNVYRPAEVPKYTSANAKTRGFNRPRRMLWC